MQSFWSGQKGSNFIATDTFNRCHPSYELVSPQEVLAALEAAGIAYDQITRHLQEEGVQTFISSFDRLMQYLEDKRKATGLKNMPHR